MTINTGILSSLRRPQTFHSFVYLQGGRALVPLPQRLVLIGVQKGGTGVASTIYPINDHVETDALFGVGAPLALMARKAFETCGFIGQGPQLYACPVAENGAGTQRQNTLTVTGPATGAGNVVVQIAGRTITVGVAAGDSANTIAAALNTAIMAMKNFLPVTTGVVGAVVTATHVAKGVNGNDTVFTSVSNPPGVTVTPAQTVAGAGVNDETPALAAVLGPDYDAIVLENHTATSVGLALAHATAAWTASEKKWRWLIYGEPGSIATGTTLASAANDRALLVGSCEGSPSLPCEIATALGVAFCAKARPNANWDGQKIPIFPPSDALDYTNTEVEQALAAGLVPLKAVVDQQTRVQQPGVVAIQKMVTTATTVGGQPFEPTRDAAAPRTGAYIARQIDAQFAARFGPQAHPDGILLTDDTVAQIRDMVANILYAAQDASIVTNVDADLTKLVVEKDLGAPGRVNVAVAYTVVLGLHQVALVHQVQI